MSAALMADNAEELRRISGDVRRANENIKAWAMSVGGNVVLDLGSIGCLEVPADRMTELPSVAKRYEDTADCTLSVGVGMTISESYSAMKYSHAKGGSQVSLYEPEMEDELQEHAAPQQDPLAGLQKSGETGTHKLVGQDNGMGQDAAQGPTGGQVAENNPVPQADDATPGDAPDLGQAPEGQKESGDPRGSVIAALQQIKASAPVLEQMKQTNPSAFEAVKAVVQAMILMAQGMANEDVQKSEADLETLQKDALGSSGQSPAALAAYPRAAPVVAAPQNQAAPAAPGKVPGDPAFDRSWNVMHEADHGTYRTSGAMGRNGSPVVQVQYAPRKSLVPGRAGRFTSIGFYGDKHQAEAGRLHHHDMVSAGLLKDEFEGEGMLAANELEKAALPAPGAPGAPPNIAPMSSSKPLAAPGAKGGPPAIPPAGQGSPAPMPKVGAMPSVEQHQGPKLHDNLPGFMGGLKALPQGSPERGKFITAHMNHGPFLSALKAAGPAGAQMHSKLTQHLNGVGNAGFKAGATQATVKAEKKESGKKEKKTWTGQCHSCGHIFTIPAKSDDYDCPKCGGEAADDSVYPFTKEEMLSKPPVSEAQRRAMAAAAHGNSTLDIPRSVGKEFIDADKGGKLPEKTKKSDHGYDYNEISDCKANGDHLTSVDHDGYCNYCGHQDSGLTEIKGGGKKTPPKKDHLKVVKGEAIPGVPHEESEGDEHGEKSGSAEESEASWEAGPKTEKKESEWPVGTAKDGKVKTQGVDQATGAQKGTTWHSVRSGMKMGADGAVASARTSEK